MTPEQAKYLQGLINVQAEAERMFVRAKANFTSYPARDGWAKRVRQARRHVREYLASLVGSA